MNVQVIIHFIPLVVVAARLLRNKKFLGHQYHGFEIQYSERNPGARAIGRSNSTLWFETAQLPRHELNTCFMHVGTADRAEWQV